MSECRRKSSTDFNSKDLHQQNHGFVNKFVADVKKLYIYEPNKIKWMNEKPKSRRAYEPTEVNAKFFIDFLSYIIKRLVLKTRTRRKVNEK